MLRCSIGTAGLLSDLQAFVRQASAERDAAQARLSQWVESEKQAMHTATQALLDNLKTQVRTSTR